MYNTQPLINTEAILFNIEVVEYLLFVLIETEGWVSESGFLYSRLWREFQPEAAGG